MRRDEGSRGRRAGRVGGWRASGAPSGKLWEMHEVVLGEGMRVSGDNCGRPEGMGQKRLAKASKERGRVGKAGRDGGGGGRSGRAMGPIQVVLPLKRR